MASEGVAAGSRSQRRIPASALANSDYVYAYVDLRDGRMFCVGKGKGQRVLAHLKRSVAQR
jgi:hypothetical protein